MEFEEKYKNHPDKIYTEKFYKRHLDQYRQWEMEMSKKIVQFFKIKSVIDFGCGVGSYMEGCLEGGCDKVKGYEYTFEISKKYTPKNVLQFIEIGDVTKDMMINDKFDCSWSVEVAEHIPTEGSDNFVKNLCNTSSKYIFLTAASPGQKGTGHINCQPKEFWTEKISRYKFEYSEDNTKKIIDILNTVKYVPNYIKKNIMFFERIDK